MKYRTFTERELAVTRRSVKGAIHIASAEGRGVVSPSGDARRLASEACARAVANAFNDKHEPQEGS